MVVSAKEEQGNQSEGSDFSDSCEGPPDTMRIVKIDARTGKPWKRSRSKLQS